MEEREKHCSRPDSLWNQFSVHRRQLPPAILRLKLKERINPERLQKAVDQAALAHRWIVYGICLKNGAFYYHDGLRKTIRISEADWEDLPPIGVESAEGHLIGVYHKDHTLTVALFHGLTDGRGLFFFVEEQLIRAYAACTSGGAYVPDTTHCMCGDRRISDEIMVLW